MAPARKGKRQAHEGALLPGQVLAANIRAARGLLNLSQQDLAERMSAMGHTWSRPTVSEVERGARAVSVDELFGLSHALRVDISLLLSPPQAPEIEVDTGLPDLLPTWAVRGMFNLESTWKPAVIWKSNTPERIEFPGSVLLRDALQTGASPAQLSWLERSLENTKAVEDQQ